MNKHLKLVLGTIIAAILLVAAPVTQVYAYSEQPYLFDFGDATVKMDAGSTYKMWFWTRFNYTYFTEGATSKDTYVECSYKAGTEYLVFHVGEDEQGKNVFFHFYVDDDRLGTDDAHDCVEIYVQNIKTVNSTIQAPIAGGKTGTLVQQNGKVSMLYNENSVAMASFALADASGKNTSFAQQSIVKNGSNYFAVSSSETSALIPAISESDKAVMIANGYAGVCVNGNYINWP